MGRWSPSFAGQLLSGEAVYARWLEWPLCEFLPSLGMPNRLSVHGRSPSYAIGMHRANIAAQRSAEVDPKPPVMACRKHRPLWFAERSFPWERSPARSQLAQHVFRSPHWRVSLVAPAARVSRRLRRRCRAVGPTTRSYGARRRVVMRDRSSARYCDWLTGCLYFSSNGGIVAKRCDQTLALKAG